MIVVVGLGNPEAQYAKTRHNVGFVIVNAIAASFHLNFCSKPKFLSEFAKGRIQDQDVLLIKPQTYMNNSGVAVAKVCGYYNVSPEQVIVIHDDIDLLSEKVKIKTEGGNSGGHKGLESINKYIHKNYLRLRIGVGRPANKEDVPRYVLSKFTPSEQKDIDQLASNVADNFPLLLKKDVEQFLYRIRL